MKPGACLVLAAAALLAGCASTSTLMLNDDGQFADCGAWGAGAIGAAVALIRTQNCIDKYQAAGYRETGAPPVIGPQQAAASDAAALPGRDGSFRMTLPAGWVPVEPPSAAYQFYARNMATGSGLLIRSVDGGAVPDWEAYARSMSAKLAGSLDQGIASAARKVKVNGYEALRTDVDGELVKGVNLHYLGTAIKNGRTLTWLVAWCEASRFGSNHCELEQLAAGIQFQR